MLKIKFTVIYSICFYRKNCLFCCCCCCCYVAWEMIYRQRRSIISVFIAKGGLTVHPLPVLPFFSILPSAGWRWDRVGQMRWWEESCWPEAGNEEQCCYTRECIYMWQPYNAFEPWLKKQHFYKIYYKNGNNLRF